MSYTGLKNKIQNFLENDGADLVFSLDDIISQAEEMVFQRKLCAQLHLTLN